MSNRFHKGVIKKYNTFTYSSETEYELTMDQSGTIIFFDSSGSDITFMLPQVGSNAGANFKFINTTATGNSLIFKQNSLDSGTKVIKLQGAAANTQTLSTLAIGEYMECVCDGSNWYVLSHHKA